MKEWRRISSNMDDIVRMTEATVTFHCTPPHRMKRQAEALVEPAATELEEGIVRVLAKI